MTDQDVNIQGKNVPGRENGHFKGTEAALCLAGCACQTVLDFNIRFCYKQPKNGSCSPLELLRHQCFHTSQQKIQIFINPVNFPENTLPGTQLSRAYDSDVAGKADVCRFLSKTKDFIIDASSGVIISTKNFNYETDPRRFLLIIDTEGLSRHVLTINIIDVPEPPGCTADPVFFRYREKASINCVNVKEKSNKMDKIDEDYPLYQSIYRVTATDEDSLNGDILMYPTETQLSGPKKGANSFGVYSVSGIVSVRGNDPLDFEAGYHVFQLTLRATHTTGLFCQGTLIIMIRNINDEKPQSEPFPLNSINVTEEKPVGEIIARVKPTDDEDGGITYTFRTQQEKFALDPFTGIITLLQPLNPDNPNNPKTYSVEIEAIDNGNNTSAYMFTAFVEDVDDPIVCDSSFSIGAGVSVSIPENVPAFAFIYRILARDPDPGQEVDFLILNSSVNATAYFALDSHNGVISKTTRPLLDYETNPKIVAAARNRENLSLESCIGTMTLNSRNVNDESPVLTYIPDAPINIYENLAVGTKLVKLTATDRDIGDSVHYEFIDTQKEFSVNEDSGEVTIAYPLDYEDAPTPHSWVLYFSVYDNERLHSTTGTLTVILQDVNDNPPQCTQDTYIIELPESIPVETLLVSLTCTDKDRTVPNNNITYHLIMDTFSNENFTLTNNELKITYLQDYDNAMFVGMHFKYTLLVRVSDEGSPVLSTPITVMVRVSHINELNPSGTTLAFTFSLLENSPVDTLVGKSTFTDGDWPFNNIKYSIVGVNLGSPPKFYIEPDTRMIKLLGSLDKESESRYKIAVRITDLDNDAVPDPLRQRSSTTQVTVNVLNMNDEPPVCNPPHLETQIYSTIKISFIPLNCSDKDSSQEQLSYSIVGGIQDPITFQLLTEVTDELGGNKASQLSATTTVIIHVFPWTTTQPTSSTKTTTTTITTSVNNISYYWSPDNWIPAMSTLTVVLFVTCLYAIAWCLFKEIGFQVQRPCIGLALQTRVPIEKQPHLTLQLDGPRAGAHMTPQFKAATVYRVQKCCTWYCDLEHHEQHSCNQPSSLTCSQSAPCRDLEPGTSDQSSWYEMSVPTTLQLFRPGKEVLRTTLNSRW
ncbi:LOW QUALITY PROTEIN: cadherin-related family member 3-like [Megaptera novaeangliae]